MSTPNGTPQSEAARRLASLAAAARAYLDAIEGPSDQPFDVEVVRVVGRERHSHRHTLDPERVGTQPEFNPVESAMLGRILQHFFSPLELQIVRALSAGPLTPDEIRERLDRAGTTVGKTKLDLAVSELVKREVLEVTEHGHRVAGEWVLDVLRRVGPG